VNAVAVSSTARRFAATAAVVARVRSAGETLDEALEDELRKHAAEDAPAIRAMAFGTLRLLPRIDLWLEALLDRPGRGVKPPLLALACVALHQLEQSSHPAHAVVNEAVEATRTLGMSRAVGLLNAILRRFLRERDAILARALAQESGRFAHPEWLIAALRADWPADWAALLEANNAHPPLWLRVNRRRGDRARYLARLADAGIDASAGPVATDSVLLAAPCEVQSLPGFLEGESSVQDAAAQLAAPLLAAEPGMRVLDACAAPGGKSCHLLELTPDLAELVALDIDSLRLERLRQNLRRLDLGATVLRGDARRPAQWWNGRPFDRILLDAPCSATGVIRRHPDIKTLRRPEDIPVFARGQLELLHALWPLLAPRGRLLYATCSVLRAENAAVIEQFLAAQPEATERPLELAVCARTGAGTGPGASIMTGEAGMDGFYYACLERPNSPVKRSAGS
jgi:16S rRNA (cytosine967-C5)-methyltransferase